ncbi:MAG: hypothetical protein KDD69_00725 [Bdellovibrionales bacterium]|nr:hypothetical protein [Bdellovibrionales bacterium]
MAHSTQPSHNPSSAATQPRFAKIAVALALLIAGTGSMYWSRAALRTDQSARETTASHEAPLYLPDVQYVKLITLGFDRFAADILWFNTLNYFGKHFAGDKDFRWLGHMCDLVTSLDPDAEHVYEFCATLLSWVAKDHETSTRILGKAIATRPEYWRYRYLRGFNYWYFMERFDLAERDFSKAAKLPDAPAFLASLASRLMADRDNPETAIRFLQDLLEHTQDESAKKALRAKLRQAHISRELRVLEEKVKQFTDQTGTRPTRIEQLVEHKLLPGIPLDPYKKPYFIDPATGAIRTSSGKRGLSFFGKTADTGLATKEHD